MSHEQVRLQAIKQVFWDNTKIGDDGFRVDLEPLWDAMISNEVTPTPAREYAFFMALDASIIGQTLQWGMGDTEVRSQVHEFIETTPGLIQRLQEIEYES